MPSNTPDTARLRRLYVDEQMTISQVAASLGVAPQTVHNRLVAAEIPRRPSPSTPRTDITDDEIRRLYVDQQWSAPEIAAHLGCGTSTVYARLDGMGVARRPARPRRNARPGDHELRQLCATERLSLRQIAERFGVSAQAVHGWVTAAGIDRRLPGGTAPPIDTDELVERYLLGASGPELALDFGCSPATIYRRLEDAGIDRRHPSPAVDRTLLAAALADGLSAPDIASQLDVSVAAVCRALQREHLRTATQAARQRSDEHLAAILTELGQG
jgi:DNA-directed RNA polymerase specialized sigma24 family protein